MVRKFKLIYGAEDCPDVDGKQIYMAYLNYQIK